MRLVKDFNAETHEKMKNVKQSKSICFMCFKSEILGTFCCQLISILAQILF